MALPVGGGGCQVMMKITHALSLIEPWATLLAIGSRLGGKGVETRSWATSFRGPFAIHASKTVDWETCREEPFASVLQAHFGRWDFPFKLGALIGHAELLHCEKTEDLAPHQSANELAFGDFYPGRFGLVCDYATFLPKAIPARGMLSFWRLTAEQETEIAATLPYGESP